MSNCSGFNSFATMTLQFHEQKLVNSKHKKNRENAAVTDFLHTMTLSFHEINSKPHKVSKIWKSDKQCQDDLIFFKWVKSRENSEVVANATNAWNWFGIFFCVRKIRKNGAKKSFKMYWVVLASRCNEWSWKKEEENAGSSEAF